MNDNPAKILDTLSFVWYGGEGGSVYHIHHVPNIALRNIEFAFQFDGSNAACPESHKLHLIAVNKGKLMDVIQTSHGGEGGQYDKRELHVPIRLESGKVMLVRNGDLFTMMNYEEGRIDAFDYRIDTVHIPIDQVVVVEVESAEYLSDDNHHSLYDRNGHRKKRIGHHSAEYYRWDGEKLTRGR
jgi:hypothetical protein